ncbi:MAG: hypothetical protein WC667_05000 [Sulfurimonas sp.]|jgi:hypothetical protein
MKSTHCPNIYCPARLTCVHSKYWMNCRLKKEFIETLNFKEKHKSKTSQTKSYNF